MQRLRILPLTLQFSPTFPVPPTKTVVRDVALTPD